MLSIKGKAEYSEPRYWLCTKCNTLAVTRDEFHRNGDDFISFCRTPTCNCHNPDTFAQISGSFFDEAACLRTNKIKLSYKERYVDNIILLTKDMISEDIIDLVDVVSKPITVSMRLSSHERE